MNNAHKLRTILVILFWIILTPSILRPHDPLTPNGSIVSHTHITDEGWGGNTVEWWTTWSDSNYAGLYLERLDRANRAYLCHAYSYHGAIQSSQDDWALILNDSIYWKDGSYDETTIENATHVDYNTEASHSLRLTGNKVNGDYEVMSKWGKLPLYRHILWSDPYYENPNDTKYYHMVSGTLRRSESWWGERTLTGDISIPSNKRLNLISGTTVHLAGNHIKSTGGLLVRYDNVHFEPKDIEVKSINDLEGMYSTIVDAVNNASSGENIVLAYDTYGENITMKSGVNVIGSGSVNIAGSVTFNGATNCELRGVYVYNYSPATTTITINNGSASTTKLVNVRSRNRIAINNGGAYLSNVNCYQYDNNYGVDMYNAGPAIAGFTSTTSMTDPSDPAALYIHNGSSPTLYGTIRNKYRGVYLTTSSYATMHGTSFCQNAWDIYSTSAWDSDAYNSMTFSASTAAECVYGDVNLPDPGDWDWCGVAKVAATTDTLHHPVLLLPVEPVTGDAYAQSVTRYHNHRRNLLNRLQQDGAVDSAETAQGYGDLIADFAAFIQAHPADPRAAQALVYLKTSAFEGGQPEAVKTLVTDLLTDATSRPLHPELLNTLFAYYQWVQDGPQALATADRFLATYPASDLAPEVIYGKGLVYKYLLQDATGADAQFAQVIAGYPEHPVTHSALAEAQQTAEGTVAKLAMDTGQTHPWNATVVVAPNPYDIQQQTQSLQFFHLPVYARIQLYDVAGRHRLTTASQGANAALTLSAQDYPAGVYLYVVEELDGADGAPTGKRTTGKFVIIQ